MTILRTMNRQSVLILALVFVSSVSTSSLAPVMGLYIVDGLGQQPWKIGIYSVILTVLTLAANRLFGERLDQGGKVSTVLLVAIISFIAATATLAFHQSYLLLISLIAIFVGLANTALSTTFTFGRLHAEDIGLDTGIYNSWMRSCSSLAWAFGPALSFTSIGVLGYTSTFMISAGIGCLWLVMWYFAVPSSFRAPVKDKRPAQDSPTTDWLLLVAAASCVFFALSNVLYTMAMPLFFIQEVGLPSYAPGLSFAAKCLMEVPAIFGAALLARRWGPRRVLYLAAIMAMITFVAISEVRTLPQMVVTAAFEGLYYGLFAGVAITFVQSFAGGRMGRATSMYVNSLFFGGTLGSLLMGFVATWFDYKTVVLLAAGCAVCALMTLYASRRYDAASAQPSPAG